MLSSTDCKQQVDLSNHTAQFCDICARVRWPQSETSWDSPDTAVPRCDTSCTWAVMFSSETWHVMSVSLIKTDPDLIFRSPCEVVLRGDSLVWCKTKMKITSQKLCQHHRHRSQCKLASWTCPLPSEAERLKGIDGQLLRSVCTETLWIIPTSSQQWIIPMLSYDVKHDDKYLVSLMCHMTTNET